MNKQDIILELINVNKKYDDSYAVENFNLYVKKGEFITFLGPSGCGKTTTLRMIAGFEMPTSGQILLNGEDIAQLPPHKRPLNTVFQRYALFSHLDVYDNIAFGLKLKKVPYEVTDKAGNKVTKYRKYRRDEINEKVKIVDLVIVLLDARIPKSSFNPLLEEVLNNRNVLYVLTKKDKADSIETLKWLAYYEKQNKRAIALDARELKNSKVIVKEATNLLVEKRAKDLARGLKPRAIKTMIVGIPNVGKSTLINALVGKRVTAVGDKPGVTKVQQWIRINQDLELLDTPGVLWPKFDDQVIGLHLAITGGINDNILPIIDVATYFIDFLNKYYPNALTNRYQLDFTNLNAMEQLELIAKKQNYYLSNKEYDLERTALFILQEARSGYYGRFTLDRCGDETNN